MVTFREWMSIGLSTCGNDRKTFSALVDGWNREKAEIREMSEADVRENLVCP